MSDWTDEWGLPFCYVNNCRGGGGESGGMPRRKGCAKDVRDVRNEAFFFREGPQWEILDSRTGFHARIH